MRFGITRFDLRTFGRSFAIAIVLLLLATAVMLSTDGEPAVSSARLARLGALSPVFGALASMLSIAQSRSRGEALALQSLGVPPWRVFAAAYSAAFLLGILGAIAAASQEDSIAGLFPRIAEIDWICAADGSCSSASLGIALSSRGEVVSFQAQPPQLGLVVSRLPVFATILAASLVLPVWLQSRRSWIGHILSGVVALLVQIALFHYVGAGRLNAWLLTLGPAILAGHWAILSQRRLRIL